MHPKRLANAITERKSRDSLTDMDSIDRSTRRKFIKSGGIVIASSMIATAHNLLAKEEEKRENEVSPPEDLMREHGVLKRILLVYGEALRRMEANQELPPEPIQESAKIIRSFVEDYHEKLEERYLFPRFKKQTSWSILSMCFCSNTKAVAGSPTSRYSSRPIRR
jgi:hypothetical protein